MINEAVGLGNCLRYEIRLFKYLFIQNQPNLILSVLEARSTILGLSAFHKFDPEMALHKLDTTSMIL